MVVVGPGIGGLLLLTGGPVIGVAVNAASFAVAAGIISRLRVRSRGGASAGESAVRSLVTGVKALAAQPVAVAVILFCALDSAVYGAASVLYVPLSVRLGTGANGYSYLLAGTALGAVLGAGLANRLSGAARLAPVIMGSLCLQALPYLATVPVHWPALAAILQVVSGFGMVIVDVLAITTLQRDLPGEVLSRVLGICDTLILGAILLASLAAGILLAHADVNVALVAVGVGIPAIGLVGLPTLLRADRTSAAEAERLRPLVELLSEAGSAGRRGPPHPRTARGGRPGGRHARRDGGHQGGRRGRRAVDPGQRRAVGAGQRRWNRASRPAAGDRARLRRRARPAAPHPAHRHGPDGAAVHAAADRRRGLPVRPSGQPAQPLAAGRRRGTDGAHPRRPSAVSDEPS